MTFLRLIVGVLAGLVAVSVFTELIEVSTVIFSSGLSFEYLQAHHEEYFNIRNQSGILCFKVVYNTLAAVVGGYIVAWITPRYAAVGAYTLISLQSAALIWAGFLSEMSETAPMWLWITLTPVTAAGIYAGYRLRLRIRK